MTGIWTNDGDGSDWKLTVTTGFPKEEKLHELIQDAPGMLPLVGTPRLPFWAAK